MTELDSHVEAPVLQEHARDASCLVVGAYKGDTMLYLLDHGAYAVMGIEPQKWAHDECLKRLVARGPSNWGLLNYALVPWETEVGATVLLNMYGTDAASIVHTPASDDTRQDHSTVQAMNIYQWWTGEDCPVYDLGVVNCEGSEYALLPLLAHVCDKILVQFHGPPMPVGQLDSYDSRTEIGKGWYLFR